jgi:hypothetical protein
MKRLLLCLGALCVTGCPSLNPPHAGIGEGQGVGLSASNRLNAVVWSYREESGNRAGSESVMRQTANPARVPLVEKY